MSGVGANPTFRAGRIDRTLTVTRMVNGKAVVTTYPSGLITGRAAKPRKVAHIDGATHLLESEGVLRRVQTLLSRG